MEIKKVLLFRPPHLTDFGNDINPLPPIGLGYLASVLKRASYEVVIYDSLIEYWNKPRKAYKHFEVIGPSIEEMRVFFLENQYDVVGVSILFSNQHFLAMQAVDVIRECLPDAKIIVGGPHVSVMTAEVMENKNIDYAVIGEGEESIIHVLQNIENDFDEQKFDGVAYRKNDKVIIKEKSKFIKNIDSIPFPAWELMHIDKYFSLSASHGMRTSPRFMPIMTSRGCPAKCVFCSAKKVWGMHFRARSVENIISEMKILKEKYGIEEIMFEDDNVTNNVPRAKKLFQAMIDSKLNFKWDTPNGVAVWTLSPPLLDLMKASGCFKLNIAIESGSQDVIDGVINKPLQLKKIPQILEYARSIGLNVSAFFIAGLPGETKKQIKQTFKFAIDNKLFEPHVSIATPYMGTKLYDICKDNNLFAREYSVEELYLGSYIIETNEWTHEELKTLVQKGYEDMQDAKIIAATEGFALVQRLKRLLRPYLGNLWHLVKKKYVK